MIFPHALSIDNRTKEFLLLITRRISETLTSRWTDKSPHRREKEIEFRATFLEKMTEPRKGLKGSHTTMNTYQPSRH